MNADLAGALAPLADPLHTPSRPVDARPVGRSACPSPSVATFAIVLALGMPLLSGAATAQSGSADPRTMTVEELERHIAEQKAALERVRENRDITAEKAAEVREALAEREAKRLETEAEVETLCREREEIEPGSFDDCMAQLGG